MQVGRELLGETLRVSSLTFFIFLYWLFPMTEINKHGYMKTHLLIYVPNILYGLSVHFKSEKRCKTQRSSTYLARNAVFASVCLMIFYYSYFLHPIHICFVLSVQNISQYFEYCQCFLFPNISLLFNVKFYSNHHQSTCLDFCILVQVMTAFGCKAFFRILQHWMFRGTPKMKISMLLLLF